MKIENIIEDIKKDIIELGEMLEEQIRRENPSLNFFISLPDIEKLTTIKSMVLTIAEGNSNYFLGVQIHTHNGNRVFENEAKEIINHQVVPCFTRHPFQGRFVDMLRDIIKRRKSKMKFLEKKGKHNNSAKHYANTA